MNRLTMRANPLKLREYLAAGLPVVSTPMPEVVRLGASVLLAEGAGDFITRIESALAEAARDESARGRRALGMQGEGWEARVDEISRLILDRKAVAA
jgi:hypothetical protein